MWILIVHEKQIHNVEEEDWHEMSRFILHVNKNKKKMLKNDFAWRFKG